MTLQVLNRSLDPRTPSELPDPHMSPLISHLPTSPLPGVILPQQLITSGTQRDCIRLRGLPFEASVTDILTFLGEHSRNIVFQGVHMVYNAQVGFTTDVSYACQPFCLKSWGFGTVPVLGYNARTRVLGGW